MNPPSTFERVYTAIKQQLRSGELPPGARLEPAVLSDALNASVTPVRDALHRLTGERLVEAPRHDGFRAPLVSETTLRHLYAWHLDMLFLAIGRRRAQSALESSISDDPGQERLEQLFTELASRGGNPEIAIVFRNLGERLEPYRRFEEEFLGPSDDDAAAIVSAIASKDLRALRRALVQYHRARQRVVPELLARLHEQH